MLQRVVTFHILFLSLSLMWITADHEINIVREDGGVRSHDDSSIVWIVLEYTPK